MYYIKYIIHIYKFKKRLKIIGAWEKFFPTRKMTFCLVTFSS